MDEDDKAEPPLTYYDLNLRFCGYKGETEPPTFKVYIEGDTRAGSMAPDKAEVQEYNAKKFWDEPTEYTGGLMEKLESGQISERDLLALGRLLTELALPGDILKLFKNNLETLKAGEEGLRLRLRIDIPELARLPWEYMILTDRAPGEDKVEDFLARRGDISIVRTGTVYEKMLDFAPSSPIRIAGVLSNPSESPDGDKLSSLKVDEDKDAIDNLVAELRRLTRDERLEEVRWAPRPATIEALETALEKPADIFYYAGHARFDPLQDGLLILEKENDGSEYYASRNLIDHLKKAHVRLVILNACETAYGEKKKRWSGSASNLEREQIPIVIGNQFKIDDEHARLLAEKIFIYLFIGYTIDQALYEARKAIYKSNDGPEIHRNWGVPVLYLRGLVDNPVFFPKQKSKIRQNFYKRALDCYQAMENVQVKINKACEPFVSGKLVRSEQRDEVTTCINDLNPHIVNFRNLLGEIQLGWFAEVDASKIDASLLRRYQIMVDLDYLEEQWEDDLDVHLSGFPLDGQKRARRDQCNQIRKDLEQLGEKLKAIQIAYIDLLKSADVEDTNVEDMNKVNV